MVFKSISFYVGKINDKQQVLMSYSITLQIGGSRPQTDWRLQATNRLEAPGHKPIGGSRPQTDWGFQATNRLGAPGHKPIGGSRPQTDWGLQATNRMGAPSHKPVGDSSCNNFSSWYRHNKDTNLHLVFFTQTMLSTSSTKLHLLVSCRLEPITVHDLLNNKYCRRMSFATNILCSQKFLGIENSVFSDIWRCWLTDTIMYYEQPKFSKITNFVRNSYTNTFSMPVGPGLWKVEKFKVKIISYSCWLEDSCYKIAKLTWYVSSKTRYHTINDVTPVRMLKVKYINQENYKYTIK